MTSELDLRAFTHKEEDSWYNKPFSLVDRYGKVWDAATDRVRFVAVKRRAKYRRFDGPGDELSQMLNWLHGPEDNPHDIQVDDMLRWIGPSLKGVRLGQILDVTVSINLLASLLKTAPLKTVDMWVATKLVSDPRCLAMGVAGRWRALLMGHDETSSSERDLPSFDVGGTQREAFELAMTLDDG